MSLAKLIENAAERLHVASVRIADARMKPATPANLAEWLEALTDFSLALSDIATYNNESVHEKIQEISRRAKLGDMKPKDKKGG